MSSALAGTDTGDNGQPAHASLFHSLNRSSGTASVSDECHAIAQSAEGSCLVVRKAPPELREAAADRFAQPTVPALIERDEGLFSHHSCGHIADKKRRRWQTGLRHIITYCK